MVDKAEIDKYLDEQKELKKDYEMLENKMEEQT